MLEKSETTQCQAKANNRKDIEMGTLNECVYSSRWRRRLRGGKEKRKREEEKRKGKGKGTTMKPQKETEYEQSE